MKMEVKFYRIDEDKLDGFGFFNPPTPLSESVLRVLREGGYTPKLKGNVLSFQHPEQSFTFDYTVHATLEDMNPAKWQERTTAEIVSLYKVAERVVQLKLRNIIRSF